MHIQLLTVMTSAESKGQRERDSQRGLSALPVELEKNIFHIMEEK